MYGDGGWGVGSGRGNLIDRINLCKLEVVVVVIKEEKYPPLSSQVKIELIMSISGVSVAIKMYIFQINDHTNKIPTPQLQISPKYFILCKTNII